ncbi:MAG: extracellular solute-binding protein [Oceanococcaceae bacterium]
MTRLTPLLLLLLAACGQSPSGPKPLTIQAVADPVETRAYQALIAAFEEQNPDTPVRFLPVGRHPEHVTRLATAFAAGRPPDLFLLNFRRWGQFLGKDLLRPVGPLLAASDDWEEEAFYPQPLEAFTVDGELVCMPQNVSSLVVYWNRSLFREAGVPPPAADWTWKDFHDAAVALTRDTNGDGQTDVYGLDVDPSIVRLAPFIWQAGGEIVDDLQAPTRFRLRERGGAIGLMFLKRLKTERGVIPSLNERRAEGPDARFMRGGAAMTLQSRRYTASLRAVKGLDWDVAHLPRYQQAASVLHADAYCLAGSSPRTETAIRFIRFATSAEGQALIAESGRIVPVRRSVAQSPAFLDPDQPPASAAVFLEAIPLLRRTPNIPAWYEIETRINPLIEEWMFEPAARMGAEANFGLVDGVRIASMIQREAGPLLAPAP